MSTASNLSSLPNREWRYAFDSSWTVSHLESTPFLFAFLLAISREVALNSTRVTSTLLDVSLAILTPLAPVPASASRNVRGPLALAMATETSRLTLAAGLKNAGYVLGSLARKLSAGTKRSVDPSRVSASFGSKKPDTYPRSI